MIFSDDQQISKTITQRLSMERNPFTTQNQMLRSYRVYIYFAYKVGIISSYSNRI